MGILIWVHHAGIGVFFITNGILFPKSILSLEYSFYYSKFFCFGRTLTLYIHMQTTFKHLKHHQKPSQTTLSTTFKIDNLIHVNTFPCQKVGSKPPSFSWSKAICVAASLQNAKLFTLCTVTDLQILQGRGEKSLGFWSEANSSTHSKRGWSGRMHKLETPLFHFTACVPTSFITFWL